MSVTYDRQAQQSTSGIFANAQNILITDGTFVVSHRYKYVVAVTDDRQAQQSRSGIFANAQNILITGGTFVVSLCYSCVCDFATYSMYRIFCLLILLETSL